MNYGLKYISEFDSISQHAYSIEILKKNYVGVPDKIVAAARPVLHQWQEDDPKAPIKGSSVTIKLVNEEGGLPLSSFYSPDDDEYKVIVYRDTQRLFEGFLVQDDCNEELSDTTHEIKLSATDNLGLLKDIKLNRNFRHTSFHFVSGIGTTLMFGSAVPAVNSGDRVQIVDINTTPYTDKGTYTVASAGSSTISTVETIPAFASMFALVYTYRNDIEGKISLMNIISACLYQTGLELSANVYSKLKETNQSTDFSFLDQTTVGIETFLKGDEWLSCYDVLEKILSRFKLTLFQSLGQWQIIRWDEYKYFKPSTFSAHSFNSSFISTGAKNYDRAYAIDTTESYLIHSLFRPYNSVKETFNYDQRAGLFENSSLRTLGAFIAQSTVGDTLYKDYQLKTFSNQNGNTAFIRVEYDATLLIEKQRYIYNPYIHDASKYFQAKDIDANMGDRIDFSVSFRNIADSNFSVQYRVEIRLYQDASNIWYLGYENNQTMAGPLIWRLNDSLGAVVSINRTGSENLTEWSTWTLSSLNNSKTAKIPAEGRLQILIRPNFTVAQKDTNIKEFRLEYYAYLNDSTRITAHTHDTAQGINVKNKSDEEIFIDDSPRNSLAGTLFMPTVTGLLQDRTKLWNRAPGVVTESKPLGQIMTFEELFWRRIQRSKLEGNLIGLVQDDKDLSMLSVVTHPSFDEENFAFGQLEIDYRNNSANGTIWELFRDSEADANLTSKYDFRYLYDNN